MIIWSERFSVGNIDIDQQHKVWISIIDEITELLKADDYDFSKIYNVVTKMDEYISYHFNYEENLMKKNSFPEIESHILQHNLLRDEMVNFNIFDVTKPKEFVSETLVYLVDWLSNHIMQTDRKLGDYLNQLIIND